MTAALTVTEQLITITCGECGTQFAMGEGLYRSAKDHGATFY